MLVVSNDGLKLAEVGTLATLPVHIKELHRPQILTDAMFRLTDRISKEIHGRPFNDLFIESRQGVIYLRPLWDKAIVFIDWTNDIELKTVMNQWEDVQVSLKPLEEAFNKI